jgi:Ca2+-binding EF-hand superfamily protein
MLSVLDLQEFLQDSFEQYGIVFRLEEIAIIASKILPSVDRSDEALESSHGKTFIRPDDFIKFCTVEADRQDWMLATKRIKRTIQKALVAGIDVEQLIAEKEFAGDDQISVVNFKLVMSNLSKFGKFSPQDVDIIARYLSSTSGGGTQASPNSLSAKMVAGFLGIKYTGNVEARMRRCLCSSPDGTYVATERPSLPLEAVFILADQASSRTKQVTPATRSKCSSRLSFDDMEDRLKALRVYNFASHEQVTGVLTRASNFSGTSSGDGLSVMELLNYLKIDYSASLGDGTNPTSPRGTTANKSMAGVTAEELLKMLIDKAATDAAGIDQVFRHFDSDGNGSITEEELTKGLENLRIFDAIPNWKSQVPEIMSHFDSSGDGSVSLSEFFKFLGAEKYIPNIIQKMTKVFAKSKLPLQTIFDLFDPTKVGSIRGPQLQKGLGEIGGFDDIAPSDIEVIIRQFDQNGDGDITGPEFVSFFTGRVEQAKRDGKVKNTIRIKRRLQEVMKTVVESGGTIEGIFHHFDQDKEGTISSEELARGITSMKHFKQLNETDIRDLVALLDTDGDGTISLTEFKEFIGLSPEAMKKINTEKKTNEILIRLRAILKGAQAQNKSPQQVFAHLDKNGDGDLTLSELKEGLLKIKGFSNFPEEAYQELFRWIDRDGSNSVSVQEFIGLVMNEGSSSPRGGAVAAASAPVPKKTEDPPPSAEDIPKNFSKRLIRLTDSEPGGLAGFIAFMDDDEDGLISFNRLMKYLRREELFDRYLSEAQVDDLLTPLVRKDGQIRADQLLKFIENGGTNRDFLSEPIEDYAPYQSGDEDDEVDEGRGKREDDYEYSADPEIRAIEKKLRDIGNKLAKKGMDIEHLFKSYDPRHTGIIRRTEFLEILSSMGMYILERGKSLSGGGGGEGKRSIYDQEDDTRLSQQRQVAKLKQRAGGSYGETSGQAAKKYVGKSQSDFKVCDSLLASASLLLTSFPLQDHLESLAMVDWYRQGQKRMLLQRVLSHSLASTIYLYPRCAPAHCAALTLPTLKVRQDSVLRVPADQPLRPRGALHHRSP